MIVRIHKPEEIEKMRIAGKAAAKLLDHVGKMVKPGISTQEINDEAEKWTQEHGYVSAPLGYKPEGYSPFPGSICTSKNEIICHGKPSSDDVLTDGDIINIDVTPIVNGWHGDTSKTFGVGIISESSRRLIEATENCLALGIKEVRPGAHIGNIGAAIQEYAESLGYSVVQEFVGHGIHEFFHTDPIVPHYGTRGNGLVLQSGMIFTIEPMINLGGKEPELIDDWVAVTKDGSLSAQFEHTVLVTEDGVEVLTVLVE